MKPTFGIVGNNGGGVIEQNLIAVTFRGVFDLEEYGHKI